MTTHTESRTSVLDVIRLVMAVAFIAAGIFGFYHFEEQSQLYRALALVGVVMISAALVFTTDPGRSAWSFMKASRVEVRKVIWPSRTETTQTTIIVFVMVFIVGLFLWLLDMFLFWGVRLLTGQGG